MTKPDHELFRAPPGAHCYSFGVCSGWSQLYFIGPVPIYFTEYFTLGVGGDASVNAQFDTSANASFSTSLGVGWDHNQGFYGIHSFNSHWGFKPPTINGTASVRHTWPQRSIS